MDNTSVGGPGTLRSIMTVPWLISIPGRRILGVGFGLGGDGF